MYLNQEEKDEILKFGKNLVHLFNLKPEEVDEMCDGVIVEELGTRIIGMKRGLCEGCNNHGTHDCYLPLKHKKGAEYVNSIINSEDFLPTVARRIEKFIPLFYEAPDKFPSEYLVKYKQNPYVGVDAFNKWVGIKDAEIKHQYYNLFMNIN